MDAVRRSRRIVERDELRGQWVLEEHEAMDDMQDSGAIMPWTSCMEADVDPTTGELFIFPQVVRADSVASELWWPYPRNPPGYLWQDEKTCVRARNIWWDKEDEEAQLAAWVPAPPAAASAASPSPPSDLDDEMPWALQVDVCINESDLAPMSDNEDQSAAPVSGPPAAAPATPAATKRCRRSAGAAKASPPKRSARNVNEEQRRAGVERRARERKERKARKLRERQRILCPLNVFVRLEQMVVPEAAPENALLAPPPADPADDVNMEADQVQGVVQLDAPAPGAQAAAAPTVVSSAPAANLMKRSSSRIARKADSQQERRAREQQQQQQNLEFVEKKKSERRERREQKAREQQEVLCPPIQQLQQQQEVEPEAAPEDAPWAPPLVEPEVDEEPAWKRFQLLPETRVGVRRSPRNLEKTNGSIAYCKRGWPHVW
jgi:hypothetical protein